MAIRIRGNYRLRKLRWVMIAAMCADLTLTLAGQPISYWHDPNTAAEANAFFAAAMQRGWLVYVLIAAACGASVLFLTMILPERIALVVLLAATFSCYFGASSWLVYRFGLGSAGETLLAIALSIALVKAGLTLRGTTTDA